MIGSSSQTGNPGNADRRIHRQGRCGWQSLGGRKRARGCFPIGWKQSRAFGAAFWSQGSLNSCYPWFMCCFSFWIEAFPQSFPSQVGAEVNQLPGAWTSQNSRRITNRKPKLTLLIYKSINFSQLRPPQNSSVASKIIQGSRQRFGKRLFWQNEC